MIKSNNINVQYIYVYICIISLININSNNNHLINMSSTIVQNLKVYHHLCNLIILYLVYTSLG